MVRVFCAIVGDGAAFSVRVEKAEWEDEDGYLVEDLKEVVKAQSRGTITVASSRLRLFLAKKGERWLTNSDTPAVKLDTDRQPVAVEEDGSTHPFVKMDETVDVLFYFGKDFERKSGEVHVLVVVPVQERHLLELWRVSGSIENALSTKGIRCRVNRLAASYLGYYDPARRTGEKDIALWYVGKTLCIYVLFETRENALLFDNALHDDCCSPLSALNGRTVSIDVAPVSGPAIAKLRRIYSHDYDPNDSESPQATGTSLSTTTSIVDVATDEFKYQRIEAETVFGHLGKAQSCPLMSREHCQRYASFLEYDNDPNNRLALSSEMHGWYDGSNVAVPVLSISIESVSERPVNGTRYEVVLMVHALDTEYGKLISMRLKEGSVVLEDHLKMRTSVFVENPKVFQVCMEWKRKDIEKKWSAYYSMKPAAD